MNEVFDNFNLPYQRLGNGPEHLLCFHGVGQDGYSCFQSFEKYLGSLYTIYVFDLPFHGRNTTSINLLHSESISKKNWKSVLQKFLSDEHIQQFDVAGFSIGGRFALATIESFSPQIRRAYLMAPDGIHEHPVYSFVTRFAPARTVYRSIITRPATLFRLLTFIEKLHLIPSKVIQFSRNMVETEEKRTTVYNSWIGFRDLKFDIPALYEASIKGKIQLYLFVGKNDQLLPVDSLRKLSALLPPDRFIILPCGHSKVVEQTAKYLEPKGFL